MWELYNCLIKDVPADIKVDMVVIGDVWTAVKTACGNVGIAMTTARGEKPAPEKFPGKTLAETAAFVKSWNLYEASVGMAALNAFYNDNRRMKELDLAQKQEGHSTFGMEVAGREIVMVGALKSRKSLEERGAHVSVLEMEDKPGTYPGSACEYLIPGCDILVVTASALINKTMPRLLELGRGSTIVVAGPSAPMTEELLHFGVSRITGMTVTDTDGMLMHAMSGVAGQPYGYAERFCVEKKHE